MSMKCPRRPLIAVIGATGTALKLAVSLAERFNGEIINGDCIQMYDGLPIATNKMPIEERKSVPHHLLGGISLRERPWQVTTFRQNAVNVIDEIHSRGKLPILVGGTHYYIQALIFRDAILGETTQHLVADGSLEHTWPILKASKEEMLEELRKVDPVMAARWHPNDQRKIKRSLEIYLTTGHKASEIYEHQQKQKYGGKLNQRESTLMKGAAGEEGQNPTSVTISPLSFDALVFWTHVDSNILNSRLDERVDAMIGSGLISEVQSMFSYLREMELGGQEVDHTSGIWAAIGYKQFLPYLSATQATDTGADRITDTDKLEKLRQEGIERTKIETRQCARSQIKWIRNSLLRLLEEHHLDKTLYLLNATDSCAHICNIEAVAFGLTRMFLRGDPLPLPKSVSSIAERMLAVKEKDDLYARYCNFCDKTLMTEDQWTGHVKSKKHLSAIIPKKDWRSLYPARISKHTSNALDYSA
ncbi:hypothetical protein MMC07_009983 [Pseudocyphellaria aurata]|nr:hypothetical protein [Pseudocyphellaria aurata]